jgi:hypothetical protein
MQTAQMSNPALKKPAVWTDCIPATFLAMTVNALLETCAPRFHLDATNRMQRLANSCHFSVPLPSNRYTKAQLDGAPQSSATASHSNPISLRPQHQPYQCLQLTS